MYSEIPVFEINFEKAVENFWDTRLEVFQDKNGFEVTVFEKAVFDIKPSSQFLTGQNLQLYT